VGLLYSFAMPLSDHERKLLAEMEAAFEQEDPRLVSTLTGNARTKQGSLVLYGALGVLAGMAILFGGLIAKVILVGLLGFVVSLIGAFLIVSNLSLTKSSKRGVKAKKPKWSDRLEGRWDRRNFDN
jgi:hypothetical protein